VPWGDARGAPRRPTLRAFRPEGGASARPALEAPASWRSGTSRCRRSVLWESQLSLGPCAFAQGVSRKKCLSLASYLHYIFADYHHGYTTTTMSASSCDQRNNKNST